MCGKKAHHHNSMGKLFCTKECFMQMSDTDNGDCMKCVKRFSTKDETHEDGERNIFYTDSNVQLVNHVLKAGQKIGLGKKNELPERHVKATQVFSITQGSVRVTIFSDMNTKWSYDIMALSSFESNPTTKDMIVIPPNTLHLIENLSEDVDAHLFTFYSPPVH